MGALFVCCELGSHSKLKHIETVLVYNVNNAHKVRFIAKVTRFSLFSSKNKSLIKNSKSGVIQLTESNFAP